MPLNVSREEVLTAYEHEVKKLRRLGREWRLKESDVNQIINESLHFVEHNERQNNDEVSETKLTKQRDSLFSFQLSLKIIVIILMLFVTTSLFLTYHKSTYNLVVRNVQELIYPTMKCLRRITLPIVRAFPSITVWYDEMCLVENPYFRATDINCWACEEVRSVLDLTDINNPRDFQLHTGFPYIVKGAGSLVSYEDVGRMYAENREMLDRDAYRISSTESEWTTLHDLMQHDLAKHPTQHKQAHVVWRVNRMEPARALRKLFPRPVFIPDTVNMERFILVDEPNAAQYKLPFPEGYRVFVMQGSGERLLILEPVEGCSINCTRVSVLLKPSDFLFYNSWFYRPKSNPVENSTSISVTYVGSL